MFLNQAIKNPFVRRPVNFIAFKIVLKTNIADTMLVE